MTPRGQDHARSTWLSIRAIPFVVLLTGDV
jgi:hypothetical protein